MPHLATIGFGGGCHWCTEAVFQSLVGVTNVDQGWISPKGCIEEFSEAVIVSYDPLKISLDVLVDIHLHTHSSTSQHQFRKKYRSAVYVYSAEQHFEVVEIINSLQANFEHPLVTQVLTFGWFKSNSEYKNYYYDNPEKPFCENFINPKLKLLLEQFSSYADIKKITL